MAKPELGKEKLNYLFYSLFCPFWLNIDHDAARDEANSDMLQSGFEPATYTYVVGVKNAPNTMGFAFETRNYYIEWRVKVEQKRLRVGGELFPIPPPNSHFFFFFFWGGGGIRNSRSFILLFLHMHKSSPNCGIWRSNLPVGHP